VVPEPVQEVGHLPEHDAAVHVQQVAGGEDHHERRDPGGDGTEGERPDERQELPDEAGQAGQPARCEDEEPEDRGPDRHPRREAPHLRDRSIMGSLVDHADEQEQATRDEAVVDHLEDRALDALLGEYEQAERDKAHVADRRERDQALEVGLDERHDRAVDDGDQRQDDDDRRERVGRVREKRHREPDEAVGPEFEQDRGQDHRARRRSLRVGVRQPGVEGEHGYLDREGQEERQERPDLEGRRKAAAGRERAQRLEVEGAHPRSADRLI